MPFRSDTERNESIASRMTRLSPRQKECLRLVYRRRTAKEIAAELGLSIGTVGTYCTVATATLGARNRRHAAEMLAAYEGEPPEKVEFDSYGDEGRGGEPAREWAGSDGDWRRWLPLRTKGVAHNDLGFFARLGWIFGLAFAFAVGFGMLAVGLRALSDLFRTLG